MPRKPTPTTDLTPAGVAEGAVAQGHQALSEVAAIGQVQTSALEVGRLIGRIEHATFSATVAQKVIAESFISLREGKKYKDLLISDENGNTRRVADFEEACRHLFGQSYRTCLEAAQNFESLGGELYERALQLGLRTKEYRAIRALPGDEQTLVQQAIEAATDRESVADLIGELTERHAAKLAEKDKAIDDAKAAAQAKDKLMERVRERANAAEERLAQYEAGVAPVDTRVEALTADITAHGKKADDALRLVELLLESIDTIVTQIYETPVESRPDTAGAVALVQRTRDQAYRLATTVGRIQAIVDSRLAPVVEGLEQYQPYTDADGRPMGDD